MSSQFKKKPININKVMEIFDNDVELFLELINKFIRVYPRYLRKIRNAIKESDLKALTEASYRVKSLLLNLVVDEAQEYLTEIERFEENFNFNNAINNYKKLDVELKNLKEYVSRSGWDKLSEEIKELN